MTRFLGILMSAFLVMAMGCGKKDDKDKGDKGDKGASVDKGDKGGAPDKPSDQPKDEGPNSCDFNSTGFKKACMEYHGANSSEAEVQDNCKAWGDDAKYLKGPCPGEGVVAECVMVMGPSKQREVYYEGVDLAEVEKDCKNNQAEFSKL